MKKFSMAILLVFFSFFYACRVEAPEVFGEFSGVHLSLAKEEATFYVGDLVQISVAVNSDFSTYSQYDFTLEAFVSSSNNTTTPVSLLASEDSVENLNRLTVSFSGEKESVYSSPILKKNFYIKSDTAGNCEIKLNGKAFRKDALPVDLCEKHLYFDFQGREE